MFRFCLMLLACLPPTRNNIAGDDCDKEKDCCVVKVLCVCEEIPRVSSSYKTGRNINLSAANIIWSE